jgi:hypothetical protein
MPTIKARKQTNGQTRYAAIVRIRRGGAILHRESRTFTHRSAAIRHARHLNQTAAEKAILQHVLIAPIHEILFGVLAVFL